jgi:nicotinate-nucleotide adenylyltransferase
MWSLNLENSVGLFGGTFNPLHDAHILVAENALKQYALREVVFVPSGVPPHKDVEGGVSKEHRYEMVKQAIARFSAFSVSRIEIDREGPSYTIDTIQALRSCYPTRLCFILGADLLSQIETWKESRALLDSVPFIVAPRYGINREAFSMPPFDSAEIHFLEMKAVDLSSRWIRERIKRGEGIEHCVPQEVFAYIETHGLYRNEHLAKIGSSE